MYLLLSALSFGLLDRRISEERNHIDNEDWNDLYNQNWYNFYHGNDSNHAERNHSNNACYDSNSQLHPD